MGLKNIVNVGENSYMVSSCWTMDHGYETMVFASRGFQNETNKESEIDFSIIDFSDLYNRRYLTEEEMAKVHEEICENLENYLC